MTEFWIFTLATKTSTCLQTDQARWLALLPGCEHDDLIYKTFPWKSFSSYLKCILTQCSTGHFLCCSLLHNCHPSFPFIFPWYILNLKHMVQK